MDKGIGFSRTIKLDWLDLAAFLCIQQTDPKEIKQQLENSISAAVKGNDARRKTLDVLSAIWIKTEQTAPKLREEALAIFPTLSSSAQRLWIHYGMVLLCYPFFRRVTAIIGQRSRMEDTISRKFVKEKMAGEYGQLGALNRSVERVMASLMDWGLLAKTEEKDIYKIVYKQYRAEKQIESWLLACALFAYPAETLAFNDLVRLPELFPFVFTLGIDDFLRDPHFEVQRQGGQLHMIRLRSAFTMPNSFR